MNFRGQDDVACTRFDVLQTRVPLGQSGAVRCQGTAEGGGEVKDRNFIQSLRAGRYSFRRFNARSRESECTLTVTALVCLSSETSRNPGSTPSTRTKPHGG